MTVIREVEVDGRIVDVRLADGVVEAIGARGTDLRIGHRGDVVDGAGGALLPGLHDHHIHLLATAAARTSIDVSSGLAALADAPAGTGWLRAVGSLDDDLDATRIDQYVVDRPVRVQHHSGALWTFNTAAMDALGIDPATQGRLFRADDWLRDRLPDRSSTPDLVCLGAELAAYGITGVTDATPGLEAGTATGLDRTLPQHVHALGTRKIVIADHELPAYDELRDLVRAQHDADRPVAVHCVTREALALLVAVLDDIGTVPGDRVEHAAVADDALGKELAARALTVVTQPGFLRSRGDHYLAEVDPRDRDDLYRYAGLRNLGVTVVPSSDAPYGPLDPWTVIRAARDRQTESGATLGATESVAVAVALDGYLKTPDDLAGPARRVEVGAPADLVLLSCSLAEMLDHPRAEHVRRTWIDGAVAYR